MKKIIEKAADRINEKLEKRYEETDNTPEGDAAITGCMAFMGLILLACTVGFIYFTFFFRSTCGA